MNRYEAACDLIRKLDIARELTYADIELTQSEREAVNKAMERYLRLSAISRLRIPEQGSGQRRVEKYRPERIVWL